MDARSRHRLSRKACESRRARVFEEARRARSVEPEAGATLASRRAAVAAYFAADIKDVLAMGQAPATEEPRREHAGANAAFALGHPYLGRTLRIVARCTGGWWSSTRAVRATSAYARRRRER